MNSTNCTLVCGSYESKELAELYLEKVGVPLVGSLGLIGNIAAIAVLRYEYPTKNAKCLS